MNLKFSLGLLLLSLIMISCGSNDAERFVGTWTGDVNCAGDVDSIAMTIALGVEDNTVLITLEDAPIINGTVDGDNLTLVKTNIPDGGGESTDLSGSGSLNDDDTQLIMNFIVEFLEDGVVTDSGTCTSTLTK